MATPHLEQTLVLMHDIVWPYGSQDCWREPVR
jgi:hypothetical protein